MENFSKRNTSEKFFQLSTDFPLSSSLAYTVIMGNRAKKMFVYFLTRIPFYVPFQYTDNINIS